MNTCGEFLFADFLNYYGIDLFGMFKDDFELSPRRVVILFLGLPISSESVSRFREVPASSGWGKSEYLTACLIDAVNQNTYATIQVNSSKKLKAPKRFPIPGMEDKGKNSFVEMARAHLKGATKEE